MTTLGLADSGETFTDVSDTEVIIRKGFISMLLKELKTLYNIIKEVLRVRNGLG